MISDLNGENWLPDKPNNGPSEYIENMVLYLQVIKLLFLKYLFYFYIKILQLKQTIYFQLQNNYWYYIETCFRDATNHLPKIFLEILLNASVVKVYNIYAVDNLRVDIEHLENYFKALSNNHLGIADCIIPLKNLVNIFYTKNIDIYLHRNKYVDNFFDIKIDELIRFLSKYKNLKKSSEMKGKISENDIANFIKKLKEIK